MRGKRIAALCLCMALGASVFTAAAQKPEQRKAGTEKSGLELTVKDCNVRLECSDSGQMEYDYNSKYYSVSSKGDETAASIHVSRLENGGERESDQFVMIRVPEGDWDTITVKADSAGIALPEMNVDFRVWGRDSAVSATIPEKYDRSMSLALADCSGSVSFHGTDDFTLTLKAVDSAVSVPEKWPVYKNNGTYRYEKGEGNGTVSIEIEDSAFAVSYAEKTAR